MHLGCIRGTDSTHVTVHRLRRRQQRCTEMKIQADWKRNWWKPDAGPPNGNSRGVLLVGPGNGERNYWNLHYDCEASVPLAPMPPELIRCAVKLARPAGKDEQRLSIPEHFECALLNGWNRSHMLADPTVQRCSAGSCVSALKHSERWSPTVPESKDSEQGGFKIQV